MNDITRFATDLARELGSEWSVKEAGSIHSGATLAGPKFDLYVSKDSEGRGFAQPSLPPGPRGEYVSWYPYKVEQPTAKFSLSRPIATLAKEIKRKVIDVLDAMWDGPQGVGTGIVRAYEYHNRMTESYRRAYAVMGKQPPEHFADNHHHSIGYASLGGLEVRPYADEWEIKLRLSVDEAEEFVRVMRAVLAEKKLAENANGEG